MLSVIILTNPQNSYHRASRAIEILKIEPKKGLNTLKHILGLLEGSKLALGPSTMLLLSIKGLSNAKNLLQLVSWVPGTTKIDPEKDF